MTNLNIKRISARKKIQYAMQIAFNMVIITFSFFLMHEHVVRRRGLVVRATFMVQKVAVRSWVQIRVGLSGDWETLSDISAVNSYLFLISEG